LLNTLERTDYTVFLNPPLHLKVGAPSPALAALLVEHDATSALIISAHNPFSKKIFSEEQNDERTADLQEFLRGFGLPVLRAVGRAPGSDWPAESAFLVFGASHLLAKTLMLVFEQSVCLWCPSSGVPELLFHPQLERHGFP
jgi:hypothetical protein